jgi:hypothetical protein
MTRLFVLSLVAGSVVSAHAGVTGITVRAGYFAGSRFTGQSGKVSLEGPSLGLDYKIFQLPTGQAIFLSPTVTWGGQLKSGNDSDATVLRVMATTRLNAPALPVYGIVGIGIGSSKTRGSTRFNTATGGLIQLGIGRDLVRTPVASTFAQLSYISGREPYRGWSLEFGVRF